MSLEKSKLYVGCSLTHAPDDFCEDVNALKSKLKETYEVYDFVGKIAGTAEDVYRWDIEYCVANCDVFLAICDYASIGLGWELNEAISLGKNVIGAAHKDAQISRLVLGAAGLKPNFKFLRYDNLQGDIPLLLGKYLA